MPSLLARRTASAYAPASSSFVQSYPTAPSAQSADFGVATQALYSEYAQAQYSQDVPVQLHYPTSSLWDANGNGGSFYYVPTSSAFYPYQHQAQFHPGIYH